MKKQEKILFASVFVLFFVSLFVLAALCDDRVISQSTFKAILVVELLVFICYSIYILRKIFVRVKRQKSANLERYDAILKGTLKHISGLPLAKGLPVEMYYGSEKIVFKKDEQEITVSRNKVTGIDVVTGDGSARKAISGAASGKYVIGGTTGAVVGALSAISTQLIISYTSDGKNKSIVLDTASSGAFSSKVIKDFRQTSTAKRTTTTEL